MNTLISILLVLLPPLLVYFSNNADKNNSKNDTVAREQLEKVYLPIHKKLNSTNFTAQSDYKAIAEEIEKVFDDEYLLIDGISKKEFKKFCNSISSDNLFTIGEAYQKFYDAFDYYYNTLKKQLGYPYNTDFKSFKYYFNNNSKFRSSIEFSGGMIFIIASLFLCYFFEIQNNELVFKTNTVEQSQSFFLIVLILEIILFLWMKLRK